MSAMVRALWNNRGFILGSVKREFQSKYRNSLLGAAWTVLNPLAMIIVYTVIFSPWPVTFLAVLLCIWGMRLFSKHPAEMVDEL